VARNTKNTPYQKLESSIVVESEDLDSFEELQTIRSDPINDTSILTISMAGSYSFSVKRDKMSTKNGVEF
jgi:hypothetical protein